MVTIFELKVGLQVEIWRRFLFRLVLGLRFEVDVIRVDRRQSDRLISNGRESRSGEAILLSLSVSPSQTRLSSHKFLSRWKFLVLTSRHLLSKPIHRFGDYLNPTKLLKSSLFFSI